MISLNVAAQVQAILLVIAAVLAGLAALLGVVRQLLGEGWWRRFRRPGATTDSGRIRNNGKDQG